MNEPQASITLSLVIPVYRGESHLPDLLTSIDALRGRWAGLGVALEVTEVICVLDAPVDASRDVLDRLAVDHPWLRLVELSRNFGQHSATVAGILHSSGDWVVTLDEDLQHDPAEIERLLRAACSNAADVVYARPLRQVHGGLYRDRSSRLAKFLVARLSGNRFIPRFNSFRLIRGDIARAASSICAQSTYFDIALTWFTTRIATVDIEMSDDRHRQQGGGGYGFGALLQHAKRLVLTSELRILRFTTSLAAVSFLASVAYGAWVLYVRLFAPEGIEATGWTSLMMVILGLGGVTVFILGLIAELLHVSMLQLQGKPAFFAVNRSQDSVLAKQVEKLGA